MFPGEYTVKSKQAKQPMCVFLSGDVMTGRGIDQVLPHPGNPVLHEPSARDARDYVQLAELRNGPIPQPVDYSYVWGDSLEELQRSEADVRIINLETSITCSEDCWLDKEIHYRMHPRNVGCLTAAGINCCSLANNHVLDWGYLRAWPRQSARWIRPTWPMRVPAVTLSKPNPQLCSS
jgi:poly-gamma-glutamate synthesis protein (capsule biosynthesis protein)